MSTMQNILRKWYDEACAKPNTPETRAQLKLQIDTLFAKLDEKRIPRPVDFNVSIDSDGDLVVYFSQDYT